MSLTLGLSLLALIVLLLLLIFVILLLIRTMMNDQPVGLSELNQPGRRPEAPSPAVSAINVRPSPQGFDDDDHTTEERAGNVDGDFEDTGAENTDRWRDDTDHHALPHHRPGNEDDWEDAPTVVFTPEMAEAEIEGLDKKEP